MRKFSPFKDTLETEGTPLHIQCPCRFEKRFGSLDRFREAGGEIVSETPLIARCPRCRNVYATEAHFKSTNKGQIVAFECERGSDRRDIGSVRVADCPECGADVHNTDYYEGAGHPDIGWNHYECPECEAGIRPERIDGDGGM